MCERLYETSLSGIIAFEGVTINLIEHYNEILDDARGSVK
jgi:hypothetical protein